jgi:hypothetical protein
VEPTEHHRRAVLEAVQVFVRNPIVRWVVGGLLAMLCSVYGAARASEREPRERRTNERHHQDAGEVLRHRGKDRGDISEKLVRVEERHASHAHRIDEIVAQVSELRRRLDQMAVERDLRLGRWEASMAEHRRNTTDERALTRLMRDLLGRMRRASQ